MNRVYKVTLEVQQRQFIILPRLARILKVGVQNDLPVLWALVDPDAPPQQRIIRGVTTGERFNAADLVYLGTVTLGRTEGEGSDSGWFVWHVFEQPLQGEGDPRDHSYDEDYGAIRAQIEDENLLEAVAGTV